MALHIAVARGYSIQQLVTFAPPHGQFRAHPLPVIKRQAQALGLPHRIVTIRPPYESSYERAIARLKSEHIETLVTGDIDRVEGAPNWIRARARPIDMHVFTPLWQHSRTAILRSLLRAGFEVRFSCVLNSHLGSEWLGRTLDRSAVHELTRLSESDGLDAAGEQGEFHTITVDAPLFRRRLAIRRWRPATYQGWSYMRIEGVDLRRKTSPHEGIVPRARSRRTER